MIPQKIVYYKDELKDDFANNNIVPIKIDSSYQYVHSRLWNFCSFLLYRIIATPLAFLYMKFKFHFKIENKNVLKEVKNMGYFVYANHTQEIGDALAPTLVLFPKKVHVIVHPNNVSIPFLGHLIKFLGPLPIPNDIGASKNFINAITKHIHQKRAIVIYPEAHVWNYYTKIRNYNASSFKYPVKESVPVFAMTVTYQESNHFFFQKRKPKMVIYMDGPFYPNLELSVHERQVDLRNKVYDVMNERAKNSNVEFIQYVKREESND